MVNFTDAPAETACGAGCVVITGATFTTIVEFSLTTVPSALVAMTL